MLTEEQYQRVYATWHILQRADRAMLDEFRRETYYARLPTKVDVFVADSRVEAIPLVLSGAVRVYKIGETGREITLYRFGVGESCILTANAILSKQLFTAVATVEQPVEAIMIPAETFRNWVKRYDMWREFVFDLLSQRLSSVMEIVDEVAFRRMDMRVSAFLLERAAVENPIRVTHQEIAAELGSSREVISRILESIAAQNLIKIGRGTVEVVDMAALESRQN